MQEDSWPQLLTFLGLLFRWPTGRAAQEIAVADQICCRRRCCFCFQNAALNRRARPRGHGFDSFEFLPFLAFPSNMAVTSLPPYGCCGGRQPGSLPRVRAAPRLCQHQVARPLARLLSSNTFFSAREDLNSFSSSSLLLVAGRSYDFPALLLLFLPSLPSSDALPLVQHHWPSSLGTRVTVHPFPPRPRRAAAVQAI